LAGPNIIGVNSGAGFLSLLSVLILPLMPRLQPVAAFFGALCSVLLVYGLSRRTGATKMTLLLSGVDKSWVTASLYALFSLIPIALYNGRSGLRRPLIRFLFYAAYPAHLLLLVWLRALRIVPPHFLN